MVDKPRRRRRRRTGSLVLLLGGGGLLALVGLRLLRPDTSVDLVSQAEQAFAAAEYGRSLDLLDRALEDASADEEQARLLELRGLSNLELGREEHCFEDLREARRLTPEVAGRWIREGEAHLRFRHFDEAALLYEQAAEAFPDQDQLFRYAAGCAWYQDARMRVDQAVTDLEGSLDADLLPPLRRDAWWFAAGRRSLMELRRDYLPSDQDTPTRIRSVELLRDARGTFQRATRLLADYDLWPGMESRAGLIRARMDLASGRFYEMHRLCEVLLALEEDPALQIGLEELLANSLYDAGEAAAASQHFLGLRRLYQKVDDFPRARQCLMFSAETLLAAGEARRALDLLEAAVAEDTDDPEEAFLMGRARFLAGEPDFLPWFQRASEDLRSATGGVGDWFQKPRKGDQILVDLLEGLLAGGDAVRARSVARLGLDLFPDSLPLAQARVEALRGLRPDSGELADAMYDVLRRAPRDADRFEEWLAVSRRAQGDLAAFDTSVERSVTRVLRQFQRDVVEPWSFPRMANEPRSQEELREMSQALMNSPFVRTLPVVPGRAGEALLGDLQRDPYLAWSVIQVLRRQGQRNAAWLLHLGLADRAAEVPQFRFLLAEEEVRQGRWEAAAREYLTLVIRDPQDRESAWRLWNLWQRLELTEEARALEEDLWLRAPETSGRLLAAWSSLRHGRGDLALRQATVAAVPEVMKGWLGGIQALALDQGGTRGRVQALVREILEEDPEQPFALALLCRDLGRQAAREGDDQGAWWVATLAPLPTSRLAELGRLLLELEEPERAVEVLDQVLARDPRYLSAALDRTDALLASGDAAGLREALAQLQGTEDLPAEVRLPLLRRQVLSRVMFQGVSAGLDLLREAGLSREQEVALGPWWMLMEAARGDLREALRHLPTDRALTDDEARFLALQWTTHAPSLVVRGVPAGLKASLDSLQAAEVAAPRDRELDRWLALEWAGRGTEDFSDHLLPTLLAAAEPSLRALETPLLRRLVRRYGSLGPQVRRLALVEFRSGREVAAVRLLVNQLAEDPLDDSTRVLLNRQAMVMTPETLRVLEEDLSEEVVRAALGELVEALVATAGGGEDALAHWESVESLLTHPGVARVARLRILERDLAAHQLRPQAGGLGGQLADRNQDQLLWVQLQRELTAALTAHPEDALLISHVVARTAVREARQVSDNLRRALQHALGVCSDPPWEGYRLLARLVRDSDRHLSALDEVLTLVPVPSAPDPEAVAAWVAMAEACRRAERLADGARCLDAVREMAPHDPALLHEAGMLARSRGDHAEARSLLLRSLQCGMQDAEPLLWLARQTLESDGALDQVESFVDQAESRLAAHELRLRVEVLRLRGQLAAVRGSRRAVRFFEEACRLEGRQPEADLDWILRSFLDGNLLDQASRVRAAVAEDSPLRPLVERLLEAAQRAALE